MNSGARRFPPHNYYQYFQTDYTKYADLYIKTTIQNKNLDLARIDFYDISDNLMRCGPIKKFANNLDGTSNNLTILKDEYNYSTTYTNIGVPTDDRYIINHNQEQTGTLRFYLSKTPYYYKIKLGNNNSMMLEWKIVNNNGDTSEEDFSNNTYYLNPNNWQYFPIDANGNSTGKFSIG